MDMKRLRIPTLVRLLAYAASVAGVHGVFLWYSVVPWRHIALTVIWAVAALALLVVTVRAEGLLKCGAGRYRWPCALYLVALPLLMLAPIATGVRNLAFYVVAVAGALLLSAMGPSGNRETKGAGHVSVGAALCLAVAVAVCVLPAALTYGRSVAAQTGYPALEDATDVEINLKRAYGHPEYAPLTAEDAEAFRRIVVELPVVGEPVAVEDLEPAAGWSTQDFRVTLPSATTVEVGCRDELLVIDGEYAWRVAAPFGCKSLVDLYAELYGVYSDR